MKIGRAFRRELWILLGPLALSAIAGVFLTAYQLKKRSKEEGPWRATITQVEDVPLTPLEVWQGYDRKIKTAVEPQGHLDIPVGVSLNNNWYLSSQSNLEITTKQGSRQIKSWQHVHPFSPTFLERTSPLKTIESLFPPPPEEPKFWRIFLIDSDAVGGTAKRLNIEFRFRGIGTSNRLLGKTNPYFEDDVQNSYRYVRATSRSTVHSLPLKASLLDSTQISRNSPQLLANSVTPLSPISAHESEKHGSDSRDTDVSLRLGVEGLPLEIKNDVALVDAHFEDEGGRIVLTPDHSNSDAGKWKTLVRVSGRLRKEQIKETSNSKNARAPKTSSYFEVQCPLRLTKIPKSHGRIFLKGHLSINQCWPTPIKIEVRPTWLIKRPRSLLLEKFSVVGNTVFVQVKYNGKKPLEWRTKYGEKAFYSTRSIWDSYGDIIHIPNTERLISNWSQHLELPKGQKSWFMSRQDTEHKWVAKVKDIRPLGNQSYLIEYDSGASQLLSPGQSAVFKAEIGIENDGFIPIEATITQRTK